MKNRGALKPSRVEPVIVLGMHRSGTTMVVEALQKLGLFMGWRTEQNREPLLFIRLNNWLLGQLGGQWDHPPPLPIADEPEVLSLASGYLRIVLNSPRTLPYLGPARYLRYRSPLRVASPWGWKDPRTTLTLRVWLELFPQARIIHVVRHGIDVARSLQVREKWRLQRGQRQIERLGWLYPIRPKRSGYVSVPCLSLEGGFSLWEKYMETALSVLRELEDQALEIRYEDLVQSPDLMLHDLATFCGLDVSTQDIGAASADFSPDRRFAYRQDHHLTARASEWRGRLTRWGY